MSTETQWHPITTRLELDLKHNRGHSEVSAWKERSLILQSHGSRANLEGCLEGSPCGGRRQGGSCVFGTVRSCLSQGTDVNSLGQRRQDLQPKQRIPEALLMCQHLHLVSKLCVPLQAATSLQGGEAEPGPITLTHSAGAARPGTTSSHNGESETR